MYAIRLTGGLTAVIWTDTIQTVVILVGAIVVAGISKSNAMPFYTKPGVRLKSVYSICLNNQSHAAIFCKEKIQTVLISQTVYVDDWGCSYPIDVNFAE